MGQHEQDDLTTGMTLQMVQLNTLGQLERRHLERGVINVAPSGHCCKSTDMPGAWIPFAYMLSDPALCYTGLHLTRMSKCMLALTPPPRNTV